MLPRITTVPLVIYSHGCNPVPSTTAIEQLTRTAKRSHAIPCTYNVPPVAPYKEQLPIMAYSGVLNRLSTDGLMTVSPHDIALQTESLASPQSFTFMPSV